MALASARAQNYRWQLVYEELHVARYDRIWDGLDPQDHAELRRIAADDGHVEPSSALVARFTDAGGIAIPVSWEGAPGDMITRLDAGFLRWVHTAHRHEE